MSSDIPVTEEEEEYWKEWEKRDEESRRRSFWDRQKTLRADIKKA